ncbi:hypothetical protein GKZ75_09630 [Kocuria indica]|uniref:DUF1983 domain-containing protein n=1 Tax=Kocuria marina subsp. indica TaxID=1049583 RepID=A0A6N9R0Q2_9MICC|nr:hypothetical protein [Kocuria indica]NDO78477.1 hypothetical protein [Kocuria indica]
MKYENQRPDLVDQIKTLVQSANSVKTVPHGIKTVNPGEGLQMLSPDGSEIFWDWETAHEYDTRIAEGQAAIDQARADLDKAEADLAAGAIRVDENRAILDALGPRVDAAESTITQASQNLTALEGTVGDVSAAAAAAQSTAQDALLLGFDRNIVPSNGDGSSQAGWEQFGWNTSGTGQNNGNPGSYWLQGRKNGLTREFGAVPGEYTWAASVKASIIDTRWYLQLRLRDAAGASLGNPYLVVSQVVPNGSWLTSSGTVTLPPGTARADLYVYGQHPNGAQDPGAYQWYTGISLRRMIPGALVVNGSITGTQIAGESVAAEVVRSMTAEHRKLVVTEDALLAQATVLGTLTADQINSRRLIRGRDAILSGTVDVAQLNVTGAMSAEIVRAMDIQARRGIFTEGLTAQDATLLGTTVAETLNAGTVAARIMTSGLLQTTTAANRGVKIDNSGIRAWDSSGRQTMKIDGVSNYMTGEFSTAQSGQRVKISNAGNTAAIDLFASRSTSDHVGIWYDSPDTNVLNSVGRVLAISGSSYTRDSPGVEMWPMRGTFGFRGRWQQETDATKFVEIFNKNGLNAGAWAQIEIPFQSAFPTNNSLLFPLVSAERGAGADVVVMVQSITASSITMVVVNKSNSGNSGAIKLRAAVFNLNS